MIPDAELIPAIRVPQVGILPEELGNPGLQMDDHLRSGKPGANTLGCWDAHIASRVAMSISCFFSFMFFFIQKTSGATARRTAEVYLAEICHESRRVGLPGAGPGTWGEIPWPFQP